jgi:antitoxin (DNA-binding transcriptional repressor) of toxin-antitoxin stability system
MARENRKVVKQVALSEAKDDLSRYLREAESGEILLTRHGKPAGTGSTIVSRMAHGLPSELHPRASISAGKAIRIEDLES